MIFNLNSSFLSRYILLSVFFSVAFILFNIGQLNLSFYIWCLTQIPGTWCYYVTKRSCLIFGLTFLFLYTLYWNWAIAIYLLIWNSRHNKVFKFSFWHLWLGLFIGFAICKDNSSILLSELALLYFQACYAFFLLSSVIIKLR